MSDKKWPDPMRVAIVVDNVGMPVMGWVNSGAVLHGLAAMGQLTDRLDKIVAGKLWDLLTGEIVKRQAESGPEDGAWSSTSTVTDDQGKVELLLSYADLDLIQGDPDIVRLAVLGMAMQGAEWIGPGELHLRGRAAVVTADNVN